MNPIPSKSPNSRVHVKDIFQSLFQRPATPTKATQVAQNSMPTCTPTSTESPTSPKNSKPPFPRPHSTLVVRGSHNSQREDKGTNGLVEITTQPSANENLESETQGRHRSQSLQVVPSKTTLAPVPPAQAKMELEISSNEPTVQKVQKAVIRPSSPFRSTSPSDKQFSLNPLIQKSPEQLKAYVRLPYFDKMTDKTAFTYEPERAAAELRQYLSNPELKTFVLAAVVEKQNKASKRDKLDRFYDTLAHLLPFEDCSSFINDFLSKQQEPGALNESIQHLMRSALKKEIPLKPFLSLLKDKDLLMETLLKIQKEVTEKDKPERFYDALAQLLPFEDCAPFIDAYLEKQLNLDSLQESAKQLVRSAVKKNIPLLPLLTRWSEREIPKETRTDFARKTSITNVLCREYAYCFWDEFLTTLKRKLAGAMDKLKEPSLLRTDMDSVVQNIRKLYPKYDSLNLNDQQKLVSEVSKEHAKKFIGFAKEFLAEIYTSELPKEIVEMLRMRRKLIAEYLKNEKNQLPNDKEENPIVQLLSVSLFLNVMNPYLTGTFIMEKSEHQCNLIKQFSMLIQKLSNEFPFSGEKKDPFFGEFTKDMFNSYLVHHQLFIEKHSF